MLQTSELIVIINEFPLVASPLNDLRILAHEIPLANVDTIKSDGWTPSGREKTRVLVGFTYFYASIAI